MAIYRVTLVWALRAASALVLAFAAFNAVNSAAVYNDASASLAPAEMAYVPTPLDIVLQLVPVVGLALLVLALAEILAMQLKNARNS